VRKWELGWHEYVNFKEQIKILSRMYGFSEEELLGNQKLLWLLKKPKRQTALFVEGVGIVRVNDLERSFRDRLRSFDRFFREFEPKYKRREVSLLFVTLTTDCKLEDILGNEALANSLRSEYGKFWRAYKKRFEREGLEFLGFAKLVDVGWRGEKVHFHSVVAIPRIKVNEIYEWMKPDEGLWRWSSRVEFIRWSVRRYLANYLKKPLFNLPKGWRSYEVRVRIKRK